MDTVVETLVRDNVALSTERDDQPLPSRQGSWSLRHDPRAARWARDIARSMLTCWEVTQDAAEATLLVVSELVTNAVQHALPPVTLHLHLERTGKRILVAVTDGGPIAGPDTAAVTAADEHGRGLDIVEALAAARGRDQHIDGAITHWARLAQA
ncbi:ATP-binding protein [Streptomyces sp. Lzd4kr]|nr:ATP-binding protein [Streptomyces sp. Lzd4kr]